MFHPFTPHAMCQISPENFPGKTLQMSQKTQVPATEAGRVQGDLRRLRLGQEVKGLSPEARRSTRFHGRTSEKPRQTPEKSRKNHQMQPWESNFLDCFMLFCWIWMWFEDWWSHNIDFSKNGWCSWPSLSRIEWINDRGPTLV